MKKWLRKYYNVAFHFFLVLLIYSFWFTYSFTSISNWAVFFHIFFYASVYVVFAYTGIVFFKKFFLKGRHLSFFIYTFLFFVLGSILLQSIDAASPRAFLRSFLTAGLYQEAVILFILAVTFSGLGITFTLLKRWIETEKKNNDLAQAGLKAELESLKSSISPHFLLNTLNNLYVLTKKDPGLAGTGILELADLMKYQLYECGHDFVPLQNEVSYIKSIMSLEQLRKDDWRILMNFPEQIPEGLYIAPLLFMSLVENAIKHGYQKLHSGVIRLDVAVEGHRLNFTVMNSKLRGPHAGALPSTGLNNLKRRLEIIYPGRHQLLLSDNGDHYLAKLVILYEKE